MTSSGILPYLTIWSRIEKIDFQPSRKKLLASNFDIFWKISTRHFSKSKWEKVQKMFKIMKTDFCGKIIDYQLLQEKL